ncbi:MAG: O-antigen ligase family protein [bacterium]
MQRIDAIIGEGLFGLLALIAIGSTWLFGAWENWWFWPFITLIFTACAGFAIRLTLSARLGTARLNISSLIYTLLTIWLPFLLYALIRAIQTDVPMDAERSFLLQLTPFLLGLIAAVGLPESRKRWLAVILIINLALIGIYGIANHLLTGNAHVLWVKGFPQYQEGYHRATGTYFCPDHFSGLMEIALAMGLALVMIKGNSVIQRITGIALSGLALCGIILSRSRGGGIVAGLVIITALWLCTLSWNRRSRWWGRGGGLCFLTAGIIFFALFGGHYVQRFKEYPWGQLEYSDRFQMSAAALRAWHSAPWFGIGPGMHQNLWPHFAASQDGDREKGIWPSHINNTFHSFEAHDDWAQFLEEYGVIGLILFLTAIGSTFWFIFRRWRQWAHVLSQAASATAQAGYAWILPGMLLAGVAMGLHSFGDFNLQIPGTTWLLGILSGLTLAISRDVPPSGNQAHSGKRAAL